MQALTRLLAENWPFLLLAAILFSVAYLFLSALSRIRRRADAQFAALYRNDLPTYMERLRQNRLLFLVYRKSTILLYELDGYMALGEHDGILRCIGALDGMRLEPKERVEYYQKRLSYFASVSDEAQSRESLRLLTDYLEKLNVADDARYGEILEEARTIVRVYIDHDAKFIGKLQQRAARTKNDVVRGITQYRIAKLAHFQGDAATVEKYLQRAAKNVAGTEYEAIVCEAIRDNAVLERR